MMSHMFPLFHLILNIFFIFSLAIFLNQTYPTFFLWCLMIKALPLPQICLTVDLNHEVWRKRTCKIIFCHTFSYQFMIVFSPNYLKKWPHYQLWPYSQKSECAHNPHREILSCHSNNLFAQPLHHNSCSYKYDLLMPKYI